MASNPCRNIHFRDKTVNFSERKLLLRNRDIIAAVWKKMSPDSTTCKTVYRDRY